MIGRSVLALALQVSASFAAVLPVATFAVAPDAPFSVSKAVIEKAILCPNGLTGKEIVFLIHGTGSTGRENWQATPYAVLLPWEGKGWDICWIDLPGRSLVDAQLSAEYVAYGVQFLAPKSLTGKVNVIGHSQGGGCNPQWALTFWPSIQPLVSRYIALAPDFHGTATALLLCNGLKLPTCGPSLGQQTVGSQYMTAQNSLVDGGGGRALVPTLSVYTVFDEVVIPEYPPLDASAFLTGATVFALQDLKICGPLHLADHLSIVFDPAAYALALTTLTGGNISTFDPLDCFAFKNNTLFNAATLPDVLEGALGLVGGFITGPKSMEEPPLQPYVCSRGFAAAGTCGPAF